MNDAKLPSRRTDLVSGVRFRSAVRISRLFLEEVFFIFKRPAQKSMKKFAVLFFLTLFVVGGILGARVFRGSVAVRTDKGEADRELAGVLVAPAASSSAVSVREPVSAGYANFIVRADGHEDRFRVAIVLGRPLYNAMAELRARGQFSFAARPYEGLGYFVYEVGGIRERPQDGFYWTLFINGKKSPVGISSYVPQNGDSITWELLKN